MQELPAKYRHLPSVQLRQAEPAISTHRQPLFGQEYVHPLFAGSDPIESIVSNGVNNPAEIAQLLFHS